MKQQFLKQIDNIIFDLGGVVLDIDYTRTIQAFKDLGIQDFDKLYTQASQSGVFDDFETGKITEEEFINYLLNSMSNSCTSADVIHAWNSMLLNWNKRKLDLILELRKNYRVFLLSNTNSIHKKAFLSSLENQLGINSLDQYFETIYLSHEIGLRKPNKDVFEYVLNKENLNADKTLFLDDSIQHIEGAKSIGIQTQLIDSRLDILQFFS